MKEFTSEELSSFNGKEGKPVYIAFEGKVYDVSKSHFWSKGVHMGRHVSGRDLSSEIAAAPHGTEVLTHYPIVGILQEEKARELRHLPLSLQNLLRKFPMVRRHPHPMVVHFPIALLMASSFFLLLHLLFKTHSFELTSSYLLILGILSSPFAIGTGVFTWWINYRLKLTHFIRRKIQLSILLLVLEIILVIWRVSAPDINHPFYFMMIFLLAPVVALLGYYGGQMTFPMER